ncbi:hypothetical protein N2152v2_008199 [Parachlorella kessleri]
MRPKPRPARKQAEGSSDSDSDDSDCAQDAAVRDYLANVAGTDEDEEGNSDGAGAGARGMHSRLRQLRKFSGVDLGGIDVSSPSDDSDLTSSLSSSDSEADTDSDSSSSSGSSDSNSDSDSDDRDGMGEHAGLGYGSSDSGGGGSGSSKGEGGAGVGADAPGAAPQPGVLTAEELEGLSLEQRFPVQARFRPPPLPGQRQQKPNTGGKKQHKSAVRGAKGGKLAPGTVAGEQGGLAGGGGGWGDGEKAQLRRERITAKRAARAAGRGFDLAWVNKELQDLVGRRGDMKAFPPMGKHECKAVQRLAALYGVTAGLQGSSKMKFVVANVTERSALPQGEALLQVGHMLAAQVAYELNGTALMAGPAAAAAAAASRGGGAAGAAAGGSGRGRWAGMRGSRGGAGAGVAGGPEAAAATAQKAKKKRSHRPPRRVSFISGGAINPDDSVEVVLAAGPMLSPRAPPPDSDAVLASAPPDGPSQQPQQQPPQLAENMEGVSGWPPHTAGLGSVAAGAAPAAGLGFGAAPLAAGAPAVGWQPGDEPAAAAAAAASSAQVELLEVYEDRSGSESEEEAAAAVSSSGLLGLRAGAAAPPAVQGAGPGEGLTNAGRLLGLGLALGVGPQVFGAPLASPHGDSDDGFEAEAEVPTADLSPLSPMLSRSQQRKLARQRSRQCRGGTVAEAAVARDSDSALQDDAVPSLSLGTQLQPGGRRGKESKKGRSRTTQQRREQQQPPLPSEEVVDDGPAGLVAGDYGYFERHTTGIGSRLLAKWGFGGEGSGLGREGQGRAEPLRASRRAKGLGLGAQR